MGVEGVKDVKGRVRDDFDGAFAGRGEEVEVWGGRGGHVM